MSHAYSVVLKSLLIASCIMLIAAGSAAAQIVAVGASGTAGTGVGPGQAYPEVLTKLLAARGYQLQVANAGVRGDTTSGMLARLDAAVPTGTKIVILDLDGPRFNNMRFGIPPQRGNADAAEIMRRLRTRGIRVIQMSGRGLPRGPDGIHMSAESQAIVAGRLLPQVTAALGRR